MSNYLQDKVDQVYNDPDQNYLLTRALNDLAENKNVPFNDVSNPYAESHYGDPTVWDRVGDWLGFKTDADRYEMDRQRSSDLWLSQQQSVAREEKYNSADAQAQRMRDAGINPNLSGGVSAGDASETAEFPNEQPNLQNSSDVMNFMSNVITTGLQITTGLVDVEGKVLDNAGKALSNYTATDALAFSRIMGVLDFSDPDSFMSTVADPTMIPNTNPFSKGSRNYKVYKDVAKNIAFDRTRMTNSYFATRSKALENIGSSAGQESMPYFQNDNFKNPHTGKSYSTVLDCFREFSADVWKARKNKSKFESQVNPDLQADAVNSSNDVTSQKNEIASGLKGPIHDLITHLSDLANSQDADGFQKMFANGCLVGLYALLSRFGM